MAAVTSAQQRRNDGGSWDHRRLRSEDQRQNFSIPKPRAPQSPDTPTSPEDFVTPNSYHFPDEIEISAAQAKGTNNHKDSYTGVLADRSANSREYQRRPWEQEIEKSMGQAYGIQVPRPKQSSQRDSSDSRAPNSTSTTSRSGKRSRREVDRERDDASNWVHREKLIALEIQDHIDRGEKVPRALLDAQAASSGTRSASALQEQHDSWGSNYDRHGFASPEPTNEEHVPEEEEEEFVPEDPRTPEEIAAEAYEMDHAQSMYHSPGLRSSSSRIPISKASPLPVPQEHLERNMPVPRKRSASIGLDGEGPTTYPRTRSRSRSNGSQVMFDDTEPMPEVPPSPSKIRPPSNKSTARKASGNAATPPLGKTRTTSGSQGTSPSARPSTRDSRPRTANPPEEPAPWLADMYKPDPRLPQDQQIIPTHAKRLMQEQLERDQQHHQEQQLEPDDREQLRREKMRDSNARTWSGQREREQLEREKMREAATNQKHEPAYQPPKDQAIEPPAQEITEKRPARDPSPPIPIGEHFEPMRSPGSEHGGYTTMPKVNSPTTASHNMFTQQSIYMQDPQEEASTKKGCGCCVVM